MGERGDRARRGRLTAHAQAHIYDWGIGADLWLDTQTWNEERYLFTLQFLCWSVTLAWGPIVYSSKAMDLLEMILSSPRPHPRSWGVQPSYVFGRFAVRLLADLTPWEQWGLRCGYCLGAGFGVMLGPLRLGIHLGLRRHILSPQELEEAGYPAEADAEMQRRKRIVFQAQGGK